MSIRQKTIYIPDGDKATWTDAQLVTFMCEIDGIVSTHMNDCKAEARARVGADGGKLVYKEHHVSVAKLGKAKDSVLWQALAMALLEQVEDKDAWIAKFSKRGEPQAQRVTIK